MPQILRELSGGLPLRGVLSVPAAYATRERWPLLVFLHGHDEGAPAPLHAALRRHGPLRPGNPALATEEFVVVAPQLPYQGDAWQRFGMELTFVVEDIESEWRIDPRRVYLTGFSFGANGVLDLAVRRAFPCAALWAVDPTRVPGGDPQLPVWLSAGPAARPLGRQFASRLRLGPATGTAERVYEDRGVDHVSTAALAYYEPTVYQWLLKQRLREGLTPATHTAQTHRV